MCACSPLATAFFLLLLLPPPQTRIATRAYKLLATLSKAYLIPKKPATQSAAEAAAAAGRALSPEFESLVGYVHKELTPALNHALKDLGLVSSVGTRLRQHACDCCAGFEALVGYVHKELTPALNHALKDLGLVSCAGRVCMTPAAYTPCYTEVQGVPSCGNHVVQ